MDGQIDLNNVNNKLLEKARELSGKQTNADRIRAMSDSELADLIMKLNKHSIDELLHYCKNKALCTGLLINENRPIPSEWCKQCLIEWLQEEAEGKAE